MYFFQIIFHVKEFAIASGEYIGVIRYSNNVNITMSHRRDIHVRFFDNTQLHSLHGCVLYEHGSIVINGGVLPSATTCFIEGWLFL